MVPYCTPPASTSTAWRTFTLKMFAESNPENSQEKPRIAILLVGRHEKIVDYKKLTRFRVYLIRFYEAGKKLYILEKI